MEECRQDEIYARHENLMAIMVKATPMKEELQKYELQK